MKKSAPYPRLKILREQYGYSQIDLAKILLISQTGYSKYETGENDIPTETLKSLARLYKTSIDYLLGITDVEQSYPKNKGNRDGV